ncbi:MULTISPECIES: acyl-CoA desaturase [unclassified Curtobacterium]|uniref:fatty acid desaturase family protein n=1 Tax=unclassified Curtobacterium TaxID=257496 RepID=UPI000D949CB6|nr:MULTISPECIES: acyl-CoA desaturase [unclassified Curtobacterium]PYY43229.1 acyl-CoA desaturase [Curtobacterium sp. MCPF17_046]PYY50824.1 acyl-CoA desaturase [Curtobacterium sp. MCBD17_023]WIB16835.1 acyl-CoA desaturase [Curtobacterium sp. MCPF17_050]
MTTTPIQPGYTRTRPAAGPRGSSTSTYSAVLAQVKEHDLLRRRTGFYWSLFGSLVGTLALAWIAFAVLGESWFQLIVAGALGVVFTQFAFLSHEAAHRQVFASQRWNDRAGRYVGTFLVGLSYSWWMTKHTRHHGNPNTIGKDPDIAAGVIRFTPEDAAVTRGARSVFTRFQGWLFFPLLTLEGINLHWSAVHTVLTGADTKADVRARVLEATLLVLRFGIYLTVLFWFLPFGMACAFLGVQLAVFGVMMGASFAPNHKGMPTIAHDAKVDFFSRQVRTSRNIRGGWWVSFLMGGLNYQVEHHLFPSMPRPALKKARLLVRQHCETLDVPYTETTLLRSYGIVVRYLNRVGLAARDPFTCPMVSELRIH